MGSRLKGKIYHPLVAFVVPLFVYLLTLSPDVLPGDSGEFQALIPIGGVLHSNGYPLYLATGRVFTRIFPFGSYAWKLNLLSAIFSALGSAVLTATFSECGFPKVFSTIGAILLTLTPTLWRQSVISEVYALSALLLFALWLLGCKLRTDDSALPLLSLVAGLSLTHHLILLAAIPWPFLALKSAGRNLRRKLLAVLTLLSPLTLYLLIPINASKWYKRFPGTIFGFPEPVVRGYVSPAWMGGFWKYVLAYNYTSPRNLSRVPPLNVLASMPLQWAKSFSSEYSIAGLLVALLGLWWLYKKAKSLLVMTIPTFLIVSAFSSFYSWRYHEETGFLAIATLSGGVWIASGIYALWKDGSIARKLLSALVVLIILLWEMWSFHRMPSYWAETLGNNYLPRQWAEAALDEADPNSVVFGSWGLITPLRYLQFVEHRRNDVIVVHAPLGDKKFMSSLILQCRGMKRTPYLLIPDPKTGAKLVPVR